AAQDFAELPAVQEVVLTVAQMQRDVGAALSLAGRSHRERAVAGRRPQYALVFSGVRAAAQHADLIRHDEGGIKADAELADQLRIFLFVAGQALEKLLGAGAGNG